MYLVDTNVISEVRKGPKADAGVRAFFQLAETQQLFLSVLTLGEIRQGIERVRGRGDFVAAATLEVWLEALRQEFDHRTLAFDSDCAEVWGRLMAPDKAHPVDKQVAATALIYGLTVVTRNIRDFAMTPAKTFNPFSDGNITDR